jgi:hypothetical protein
LNGQGLTEIAKAQAKRYYGGEGKASGPAEFGKESEAASAFSDREAMTAVPWEQQEKPRSGKCFLDMPGRVCGVRDQSAQGAASLRHRQGEGGQRLDLSCYYLARL